MSYYCEIGFKAIARNIDLLVTIENIKKEIWESRHDIIIKKLSYDDASESSLRNANTDTVVNWIRSFLSVRLIFWKHRDFIGVVDDNCSHAGFSKIVFQNSCDRDYEFDAWPLDIDFFRDCAGDVSKMTAAELMDFYGCEPDDFDEGYARRSCLYDTIVNKLGLDNYFRGDIDPGDNNFVIFDILPEDNYGSIAEFARWIKRYIARKYGEDISENNNNNKPAFAKRAVLFEAFVYRCKFFASNDSCGYVCNHPNQNDRDDFDGAEYGRCFCYSCPLGIEAESEDFLDSKIDWDGYESEDAEVPEGEYLLIDIGENASEDQKAALYAYDIYMHRYDKAWLDAHRIDNLIGHSETEA